MRSNITSTMAVSRIESDEGYAGVLPLLHTCACTSMYV